jgi:tetratricopeptide (TPR) repeat protein
MSVTAEVAQPRSDRATAWLYGRRTDLLIGCGLAYVLSIPLLFGLSEATGLREWPVVWMVGLALLVNGPHYGATIVRAYEAREDRRKYFVFVVYLTLAIAALFAASSRSLWLASALLTLYATWTPWHFSGQNYGLALMFLRRRGISVDPLTKRLFYASFVLSAGTAILAIHSGYKEFVFSPNTLRVANTPNIFALKPPAVLAVPLKTALVLAYLACLGAAAWRLRQRARLRDLGPASLLVLSQALWFTVPAVLLQGRGVRAETLVFSAIWVNAAHSLQYLWVTAYYARSSQAQDSAKRFLLKALLAGTAVATLPGLIMAPNLLGTVPWDVGLAATFFAVVNLHHFILDGAIWKLRDGRVARVLLRGAEPLDPSTKAAQVRGQPWLRRLVWTVAALSLIVPLAEIYGRLALGSAKRPDDTQRPTQILKWVGRETTQMHLWIGASYAREGRHDRAISHYLRSIELFPTARVWSALGGEYRTLGQWGRARAAFEAAIELNPEVAAAHFGRAQAILKLSSGSEPGSRQEAVASLTRALELTPGHSQAALMLARVYTDLGQPDQAIRTLERTLEADKQANAAAVRRELARLTAS